MWTHQVFYSGAGAAILICGRDERRLLLTLPCQQDSSVTIKQQKANWDWCSGICSVHSYSLPCPHFLPSPRWKINRPSSQLYAAGSNKKMIQPVKSTMCHERLSYRTVTNWAMNINFWYNKDSTLNLASQISSSFQTMFWRNLDSLMCRVYTLH